jgi:myo-inositol-1(or 4)-monophosphatase
MGSAAVILAPTVVDDLSAVAVEAARLAGEQLTARFGRHDEALYSKDRAVDVVGAADLAAERVIVDLLRRERPGDAVLTEERGESAGAGTSALRWVIDPLDGTFNYLRGIPHWAVSVACEAEGRVVVGVVHDVLRQETFVVSEGRAPTLNGARWTRRSSPVLGQALITGTLGHSRTAALDRQGRVASALYAHVAQVRAMGSAALDLAWTALGRCDGFYHEEWAKPWDLAAGLALCEAAGLSVRRLGPAAEGLSPRVVVAPEEFADALCEVVERA